MPKCNFIKVATLFFYSSLWWLIDGGGWKIFQILIGEGAFQNFKLKVMKNTSCIFQPVHPKQVSPRLNNFSYHLARIF